MLCKAKSKKKFFKRPKYYALMKNKFLGILGNLGIYFLKGGLR